MRQILFRIAIPGTDRVLPLYAYGAMLSLAFLAAITVAAWRARRQGRPPEIIYNCGLVAFFGGVVGARLFYVVQYHGRFDQWWELFRIWEGGLVYYGGLIFAAVGVVGYLVLARQPVLAFLDLIAPSVALGLAFGRIGCTLNGCCFGAPTAFPWGFRWPLGSLAWHHYAAEAAAGCGLAAREFPGGGLGAVVGSLGAAWEMPPIHPSQLVSAANALGLFVVLHLMVRRTRRHGQVMLAFVGLYGVSRFLLEGLRQDTAAVYLLGLPRLLAGLGLEGAAAALPRLTISQNVAIVMVAASVLGLVWLGRSRRPGLRVEAAGATSPGRAGREPGDRTHRSKEQRKSS